MVNLSTYCSMATSGWDSRSKKMCCWAKMPDQSSYAEMHKSEIVKDLVKNLQEGVRNPICQDCWQMEDVGSKSMRQQRLENKTIDTLEEEIKSQIKFISKPICDNFMDILLPQINMYLVIFLIILLIILILNY